jgi:hypothetical protein
MMLLDRIEQDDMLIVTRLDRPRATYDEDTANAESTSPARERRGIRRWR